MAVFLDKTTKQLRLSATDLASFLGCHHRTALEMGHAAGKFDKPQFDDPSLESLFERGLEHEAAYVKTLADKGASTVVNLGDVKDAREAIAKTVAAIHAGADVIVQGGLGNDRWYGRTDILTKTASASYEVTDTKLSRETKAGTVLQLALYSVLLEDVQGTRPEHFYVVTPEKTETYRLDDYGAYFRLIRAHLSDAILEDDAALATANYPDPVDHCDICPWVGKCDRRRRKDDHLSLVAGISRTQRRELTVQSVQTMAALAGMAINPMPFTPKRGGAETYVRVREQARVQVQARDTGGLIVELLPVVLPTEKEAGQGLCRLPEPTPGDLFLDLEGDPFVGPSAGAPMLRGREYLFGLVASDGTYRASWVTSAAEEKRAFEAVVDRIMAAKATHPGMHVFHYAPYEPSAFKRLMGRHATREREIDSLLRSETFVDLYAVVRQSLRAGVERYSIKNMEPFYGFTRDVELRTARIYLQAMELAVEHDTIGELKKEVIDAVEGYNRDDCVSTLRLRDWLEELRRPLDLPRPVPKPGEASEPLDEKQQRVAGLRLQLLGEESEARYLLAYLLDYHRREDKAEWWDYFRRLELTDDELLDESGAVSGLSFVEDVRAEKRSRVHRYGYPPQEMELRRKDELKLKDQTAWAKIAAVDRVARTIDVVVGPSKSGLRPSSAFAHSHVNAGTIEDAIFAIGEGVVQGTADPLAVNLLNRVPPSTRQVVMLNADVLAVQGSPGAGKTYTGGNMICDLVAAGKKVGIAATGHKVIRNLLDAVAHEAAARKMAVKLAHKGGEEADEGDASAVRAVSDNAEALNLLVSGEANVMGGTAWLWSREECAKSVDVLFIDEAGQVSLANALAMSQAAGSLVLLGDPQQLDQPKKGSHPEGVEVSVLEHILNGAKTMPEAQGMFLAETWRFGTPICDFTSEVFYEGKLRPTTKKHLERQVLRGGVIEGAGLFVVEVAHDGNRHSSDEEVSAIAALVTQLLASGSQWIDDTGTAHPMTGEDILVVSPYNVQVSRLAEALPGVRCGTVDKFQGQQAPVAIYSMATSRPEDAPRGMEFLYSLNRLNVATSRAKCAAVVVASPKLFEPECRTPRQIQLANGLCRFRELATTLDISAGTRRS